MNEHWMQPTPAHAHRFAPTRGTARLSVDNLGRWVKK